MATVMNCGACLCDCFQGIGFSQNYYEVGGPDTAILTSVGNVRATNHPQALHLPSDLHARHRFSHNGYVRLGWPERA